MEVYDSVEFCVSDSAFYGCILALCLVFTGHPFLAFFLFLLVV